jgi:hypothetical protein
MLKKLNILIVLLLFSSLSFSQTIQKTGGYARILSMGQNPYITDPYFMTQNPAWGKYYNNFLFGDLGYSTGAFQSGGVGQFAAANFSLGRTFTLGGILARRDFLGYSIATLDPGQLVSQINGLIGGTQAVVPMDNNFEIMGSFSFGNLALGLGLSYAGTTNQDKLATGETSTGDASQFGINAGILAKLSPDLRLDVGASMLFPSTSYQPATGSKTSLSQTYIAANGRLFYQYSQKLFIVPTVILANTSGSVDVGGTSSDLPSGTTIGVGIGINYTVGDFLLAGGPGFTYRSSGIAATPTSPKLSNSQVTFPAWNLGIEWNLTDWLVGRLGYDAFTNRIIIQTPATNTTTNETTFTDYGGTEGATVGLGFRFGSFSLDATVNDDVLRQGLNNIGGGGPTFAYLSASYAMP